MPARSADRARVLVVDDDRDNREVVHALLEGAGYDVRGAEDGVRGLELVDVFDPQVLLLDFAMPGMSGAEIARSVRAQRPAQRPPDQLRALPLPPGTNTALAVS
jgi:CheY-like chemotaxis protein